ncbi:Ig-like domain-containing protein [Patescibacteria group bacterium]|nr:Ig-like domain-containing protein [Patescibacteria group bacterium]
MLWRFLHPMHKEVGQNRTVNVLRKKQVILSVAFLFSFLLILFGFHSVLAQAAPGVQENVNAVATAAGVNPNVDIFTIIGRIINIALGFVGVLLLVMLVYAGFQYMTAGGNPEQVQKATTRIRNAIIGLVIVVSAFALTNFIIDQLIGAQGGFGNFISQWTQPGGFGQWGNTGGLGNAKVIEYHYPEPNQKEVPRNTAIVITFVDRIDPASFIKDWSLTNSSAIELNDDLIKIHPQNNTSQDLLANQARATVTADGRTVVIKPNEPLGNAQANVWYQVILTGGADGIKNASGTPLLLGDFDGDYVWNFEVSTEIDTSPPRVVSRMPYTPGPHYRNIVVQVNFNEPMMPISVSGFYDPNSNNPFTNITTASESNNSSQIIPGEYRISNGYKTVEFITTDECGTNSCLMTMYCLPADSTIRTTVKAADLSATPPQAAEIGPFGFNGAVDMAGNSLDGNNDGNAQGPGTDDYHPDFIFSTTAETYLQGPVIQIIEPEILKGQVELDKDVEITFDTPLLGYSINNESFRMTATGPQETDPNTWWFFSKFMHLNDQGTEVQSGQEPKKSRVSVSHRPYLPSEAPTANQTVWDSLNLYSPNVNHQLMNVYQNCFNPAKSELPPPDTAKTGSPNICNGQNTNLDCEQSPYWKP